MEFGIIGFMVVVILAVGFVLLQRGKRPQRSVEDDGDLLITQIQEPPDEAKRRTL